MPEELSTVVPLPVTIQRQIKKQQKMRQVHALRDNGLSYSAIGREVGLHRVTVKKWLQQEPPPDEAEDVVVPEAAIEPALPPAPWSSWEEVRQVREALREYRFLFMRRPENLDTEEQQIALLLVSPVGTELATARYFLVDWYRLWTKADGQRRSSAEARKRYDSWRTRADYGAVPHLRHIQERMTEAKFERLSQFPRHPE